MTGFATLTSKNQLTLPAELITYMRLTQGAKFLVQKVDKKIVLEEILPIGELRKEVLSNPQVQKINIKYSTVEIVRLARRMKPPKSVYDY